MELDTSGDGPEGDGPDGDDPDGDDPEEDAVHSSRAEEPMDNSALSYIDRECFDELSRWLSKVSLT